MWRIHKDIFGPLCWIVFAFIVMQGKIVQSGGIFSLQLTNYKNPKHMLSSGSCCEKEAPPRCVSNCDNYVIICFSEKTNGTCSYGRYWSDTVGSGDIFDFPKQIWGITPYEFKNPLKIKFTKWKGSMHVKIEVYDSDYGTDEYNHHKNDFVDAVSAVFSSKVPGSTDTTVMSHSPMTLRGKVAVINVGMSVNCESKYLIPTCEEYCEDKDDNTGHYTCDYNIGKKVCRPGWYGSNCLFPVQTCVPQDDKFGHYKCNKTTGKKICLPGWRNVAKKCTEKIIIKKSSSSLYLKPSTSKENAKTTVQTFKQHLSTTKLAVPLSTKISSCVKSPTRTIASFTTSITTKPSAGTTSITIKLNLHSHTSSRSMTCFTPSKPTNPVSETVTPSATQVSTAIQKKSEIVRNPTVTESNRANSTSTSPFHALLSTKTSTIIPTCSYPDKVSTSALDKNINPTSKQIPKSDHTDGYRRDTLIYATTIGPFFALFLALMILLARFAIKKKRAMSISPDATFNEKKMENYDTQISQRCLSSKTRFLNKHVPPNDRFEGKETYSLGDMGYYDYSKKIPVETI